MNRTTTFFRENNYQNSIILSVSLCAIISIVTVIVVLIYKRRTGKNKKRGEEMQTHENPVYGKYDDGPIYNVVIDENAYYSS